MEMHRVSSSNLVAVGYDAESQTLRIQFNSGLYDYYNVPQHIYQGLMSAPSHGQFHAAYIKHSYRYRKIA